MVIAGFRRPAIRQKDSRRIPIAREGRHAFGPIESNAVMDDVAQLCIVDGGSPHSLQSHAPMIREEAAPGIDRAWRGDRVGALDRYLVEPMFSVPIEGRGRRSMACTVKPSMAASGRSLATRARMPSTAVHTCSRFCKSKATPPTSDLCEICGDRILITTG